MSPQIMRPATRLSTLSQRAAWLGRARYRCYLQRITNSGRLEHAPMSGARVFTHAPPASDRQMPSCLYIARTKGLGSGFETEVAEGASGSIAASQGQT